MTILRAATVSALMLSSAACGIGLQAKDGGPAIDRAYRVGAFTGITVAGAYEVNVIASGKPGVTARGSQNALDELTIEVVDGDLRIMPKRKNGSRWSSGDHGKVIVEVSGGAALREATIAGSGGIRVDRIATPSFKGTVAGSGDLAVGALDAQSAKFAVAGSGDIRAAGRTGKLSLDIAGAGDIDAPGLRAADADINIAGSGNIRAFASRTADVTIVGSGDVTLTGGAKCSVEKHGSGNVNCS